MQLSIAGKEFGVKFNMYAAEKITQTKKLPVANVQYMTAPQQYTHLSALLWGGYLGWCYAKQREPEITFEEISDFVESKEDSSTALDVIVFVADEFSKSNMYTKLIKPQQAQKKSPLAESSENTGGIQSINSPGERLASSPASITS